MQRYAAAAKKGKVKASPELLKMWGTESGRIMACSKLFAFRTKIVHLPRPSYRPNMLYFFWYTYLEDPGIHDFFLGAADPR